MLLVRRTFMARPVFSTDDFQADKHKLERYLHDGRPAIATVYAPISYPPSPLLAFRAESDGSFTLAATGMRCGCVLWVTWVAGMQCVVTLHVLDLEASKLVADECFR